MTTEVLQLARTWIANETWGIAPRSDADLAAVAKSVLICAKADGVLDDAEQAWLLGAYAARGVPAELIEELRAYDGEGDLAAVLEGSNVRHSAPRVVIYLALQACAADGELHASELAAITRMGALIGVPEDVVMQLKGIHDEEQALRRKRIQLAFPDGPPD